MNEDQMLEAQEAEEQENPSTEPEKAPEKDMDAVVAEAEERGAQRERERSQQELKSFFDRAGLKDPATGADIKSLEDFERWHAEQTLAASAAKLTEQIKGGEIQPETLREMVQAAQTKPAQPAQTQQVRDYMDKELGKITRFDPEIKTLDDLAKKDQGGRVLKLVQAGAGLADAYLACNHEALAKKMAAKAAETEREAVQHVGTGLKSQGKGGAEPPSDVMEIYRQMMPDGKDADFRKHWARKRGGA